MQPTGNHFDLDAAAVAARNGWIADSEASEFYSLLFDRSDTSHWKDNLAASAQAAFASTADRATEMVWFEPFLNMVTDVCWQARERGLGAHEPQRVRRHGSVEQPRLLYLATALIELQLYRFDFNYDGIFEVLSRADDAPLQVGPYDLNGIYLTFAQLSAGKRIVPSELFSSIGLDPESPTNLSRHLDRVPVKLRHLLLHGLWLFPFRFYGVEMLILAESLVKSDPKDGNAYYRMGEAYRRIAAATQWDFETGPSATHAPELEQTLSADPTLLEDQNYCYRRAVESLDMAIRVLDPQQLARHEEYKNYRLLVSTEWQVQTAIRSAVERQVASVDEKVQALSRQLESESNQLVWKSVEVLSLFAALMGLLITNISVLGIDGISTLERVGLIGLMALIMVGFFLLVRNTVFRVREGREGPKEVRTKPQKFSLRRPRKTAELQERISGLERDIEQMRNTNYQLAPFLDSVSGEQRRTGAQLHDGYRERTT